MHRTLAVMLVAPILVVSPLTAALSASAATVPADDLLYAADCVPGGVAGRLWAVDPDSAAMTTIGTTDVDGQCAASAAYDPKTGTAYVVLKGSGFPSLGLASVDLASGVATTVTPDFPAESLAIGPDGRAYALHDTGLYSVDLLSGATAYLGPLAIDGFGSLAVEPTSGVFYAVTTTLGLVYEVDVETLGATLIGNVESANLDRGDVGVNSVQIDAAGRWWYAVFEFGSSRGPGLFSSDAPFGDAATEFEGPLAGGASGRPMVLALLISHPSAEPPPSSAALPAAPAAPELPATGRSAPIALWASAATMLLLGGFMLLVDQLLLRRRRGSDGT